jgi:plastocyanin
VRRAVAIAAAAFALLLAAGCGGGGGSSGGGGNEVKLTDSGWEPSTLTVDKGTTVKFVNDSSDDFWPASNDHPTHLLYPGFDAKRPFVKGQSYEFTFDKVGSWGYHNHLNPSVEGTIVVK